MPLQLTPAGRAQLTMRIRANLRGDIKNAEYETMALIGGAIELAENSAWPSQRPPQLVVCPEISSSKTHQAIPLKREWFELVEVAA